MAAIFLSYSRADRPTAQIVAEALEAEGFTVWWDKVLRAGQTYDEVTETMLRESSVVVVLWSHTSVKSKWVRAEATLGQRNAVVVPAMIEDADRPIMFELTQSANLVGWGGDRKDPNWQDLVADIKRVIDPATAEAAPPVPAGAPDADSTIETTFWTSIKDTSDPSELQAYLKRYPEGHFADLAQSRLAALTGAAVPAAAVPVPAPEPAIAPPAAVPPKPEARSTPEKKKGSKLPLFAVGLLALGAAGFGAMQLLPSGETPAPIGNEEEVTPPTEACDICPKMTAIPAGSFTIGSPDDEPGRVGNEGPQKTVTLPAFEISTTEITGADWAACVDDGACSAKRGDASNPVGSVTWTEAQAYTRWLSSKSGRAYRLPSEAEWEYAARAGTDTAYWWGNSFSGGQSVSGEAAPAVSGRANPFGLKGMLGNVREWTQDCYVNNYRSLPNDGQAVLSGDCSLRTVRGGSYRHGAGEHRAANRARMSTSTADPSVGFRVVASSPAND